MREAAQIRPVNLHDIDLKVVWIIRIDAAQQSTLFRAIRAEQDLFAVRRNGGMIVGEIDHVRLPAEIERLKRRQLAHTAAVCPHYINSTALLRAEELA